MVKNMENSDETKTYKGKGKGTNPNSLKNLRPFGPGETGNPLGGQMHDPEMRAVKKLTKKEFADMATLVITGTIDELKAVVIDKKSTVLKVIYARIAIKIIERGDANAFEMTFLNRLIGKVRDELKIESDSPADIEKRYARKIMADPKMAKEVAKLVRKIEK